MAKASSPERGSLFILFAGSATVLLFLWGRQSASTTAFLAAGLGLAIAFSAALTLWLLAAFGALRAPKRILSTFLFFASLLLLAHFAALFARRVDERDRLAAGKRAVEALEALRRTGSPLPAGIAELHLDPRDERDLTYEQDGVDDYRVCFRSPGGPPSCYGSKSHRWEVWR